MKNFFIRKKRYFITLLIIVFTVNMVKDIPSWVLNNVVQKYSAGRLKLYDTTGTFWDGSGLLVAVAAKQQTEAPILVLNWKIKLGLTKFVDIKFRVGNKLIADFYINKTGSSIDNLDLSLSISQVEKLFDIIKDMSVSGNINILSTHLDIGKKIKGNIIVTIDNISSGMSRVNPLGSYSINMSMDNGSLNVSTKDGNSVLKLEGSGSVDSLILEGRIRDDSKDDMIQFITLMVLIN